MNIRILNPCYIVIILLAGTVAQNAFAEGVLIKGEPEDKAQLSQFDGKLNFWFSGNVSERDPSLIVVNSHGQRVDNHDVKLEIASRSHLRATTQKLPPDNYAIRYRVVTEDGLVVSGIRKFSIVQ
jgi:methionine-rich copper-binding protein CopC